VTDAYFLFAYPFLLDVPGYKVQAAPLPDSERDANLKMLQFISAETVARRMESQPGIWMHASGVTFRVHGESAAASRVNGRRRSILLDIAADCIPFLEAIKRSASWTPA
jgi:hypothetical protein